MLVEVDALIELTDTPEVTTAVETVTVVALLELAGTLTVETETLESLLELTTTIAPVEAVEVEVLTVTLETEALETLLTVTVVLAAGVLTAETGQTVVYKSTTMVVT
jgi:hypothetical protein